MNREECAERIHLADEYSRLITEFNDLLESLRASPGARNQDVWEALETVRAKSQAAWDEFEKHIAEHKCSDLPQRVSDFYSAVVPGRILEKAALAAADVIFVVNDDRQFVEVNEAAADAFGLRPSEIVGRRIDEFFATAGGEAVPTAWNDLLAEGVQSGVYEMSAPDPQRTFEYRSKANFAPGLHLSILREVKGSRLVLRRLLGALLEELADEVPHDPFPETVRADLLAASRSYGTDNSEDAAMRSYLAIRSLLSECGRLQRRLRRAPSIDFGSH